MATTSPAFAASSCSSGFHYAGEDNNGYATVEGLQGEVGNEDEQTLNQASHIVNFYDLEDFNDDCYNYTKNGLLQQYCWIQAGYGQGDVGGYFSSSGNHAYDETNDINEYHVNWDPTSDISGSDHSSYIVVWLKESAPPDYLYEADAISNTNGDSYLGEAWLPVKNLEPIVETETYYRDTNVTCAQLNSPAYYGADAFGNTNSSTLIESTEDNVSWHTISDTYWEEYPGISGWMGYQEVSTHRDAFLITSN